MLSQYIENDIELKQSIEQEQVLEIWIEGELEERCKLLSFNDEIIKTVEGSYYWRNNITMIKAKATKIYEFRKYIETLDKEPT